MKSAIATVLTISILVLVFVPSFGDDPPNIDLGRAEIVSQQLSEGLNLAGGAKAAVNEFYLDQGRFPSDNAEAGLAAPYKIKGRFVLSMTVSSGVILIEYGGSSAPEISGRKLELVPRESKDKLTWTCSAPYIAQQFLPAACTR